MLEIHNIHKRFGEVMALKGISFTLKKGESLAIIGESGCGKTTLAHLIAGLTSYDEGHILYHEQRVKPYQCMGNNAYRKNVQMVFQDASQSLNPLWQIEKIVKEPLKRMTTLNKREQRGKVVEALDQVGLGESFLFRLPHQLSIGQQKRVSIARAMIIKPEILIIDEGTSCLDLKAKNEMIDLLKGLQKTHEMTLILITHDYRVAKQLARHLIIMKEGQIIEAIRGYSSDDPLKTPYARALAQAGFSYKIQNKGEENEKNNNDHVPCRVPNGYWMQHKAK